MWLQIVITVAAFAAAVVAAFAAANRSGRIASARSIAAFDKHDAKDRSDFESLRTAIDELDRRNDDVHRRLIAALNLEKETDDD